MKHSHFATTEQCSSTYNEENREYLKVITETSFYSSKNVSQREVDENRQNLSQPSDTSSGNFSELLHMPSKDILWFAAKLQAQSDAYGQWLYLDIQNKLLNAVVLNLWYAYN